MINRDDVIRMAREAGVTDPDLGDFMTDYGDVEYALMKLTNIIASHVAEECAKVCDARYMGDNNREDMEARRCAAAIRSLYKPTA